MPPKKNEKQAKPQHVAAVAIGPFTWTLSSFYVIATVLFGFLLGLALYFATLFAGAPVNQQMAAVITCIQHAEAAGKSNVDEMVFRYQDCIAQAGNVSAVPFFNIAHLYSTVEQHDLALQNLMVALRVLYAEHNVGSPKDVANIPSDRIRQKFFDVFNNMAHSYLALNALGDARDSFQAAARAQPKRKDIWLSLANVHRKLNETDKAASALKVALRVDSRYAKAIFAMSLLEEDPILQKRQQEAALEFSTVDDALDLGIWAYDLGEFDFASRVFAKTGMNLLLDSLLILNKTTIRDQLLDRAVMRGIFLNPQQRPAYLVPNLKTQPWASHDELVLLGELISSIEVRTQIDNENLTHAGTWQQLVFVRNGNSYVDRWNIFPELEHVLKPLWEKYAQGMPKGSVEISTIAPGTHIRPHAGPTNHRMRLHLGIDVPKEGAAIRVANETRHWEQGRVLAFDDSFEHEVWNNSTEARTVLIFDVWHPSMTQEQKDHAVTFFASDGSNINKH